MSAGEVGRRVGIIDPAPVSTPVPATPTAPSDGRLLDVLEQVAARVRSGEVIGRATDGVLIDVVVRDVRCLLVEAAPQVLVELSPREQQVALMVARGRTNQAIASSLEISIWTVSTHLRRIFAKLAVSSRAEMVAHLLAQADFASQTAQTPHE
jgi:DNA-binding CsgD family transcriptional regulator